MNELKNMCIEGIVQYILNVIMLCTILQFLVGILFIHFNEGLHTDYRLQICLLYHCWDAQ